MFSIKWAHIINCLIGAWLVLTLVSVLNCGFVLDDVYLILHNRWLSEGAGLGQLLSSDLWAGEIHPDRASGYFFSIFYSAFGLTISFGEQSP